MPQYDLIECEQIYIQGYIEMERGNLSSALKLFNEAKIAFGKIDLQGINSFYDSNGRKYEIYSLMAQL